MSKSQNKTMNNISYKLLEIKDLIEIGDYISFDNTWYRINQVNLESFTYNFDNVVTFDMDIQVGWIPKDLMDLAIGYGLSRVVMHRASKKQKKFSIGELL